MDHGKKKFSGSREAPKKVPPLGLVIAIATAGGVVIGSAATYLFFKPLDAPKQSASPAPGGTPQGQSIAMPPQQQFTSAPQPPGEAPPGKVWSAEHGHWHDAPGALTIPASAQATVTPTPETAPAAAVAAPPAATTTPAPATEPAEKKE